MKSYYLLLAIVSIVICTPFVSYGQRSTNLELQTGLIVYIGPPRSDFAAYVPNWTVGLGFTTTNTPSLELIGLFRYDHLVFVHEYNEGFPPDYLVYPRIPSGASHRFDLSGGLRIIAPLSFPIRPYLLLRSGYWYQYYPSEEYRSIDHNSTIIRYKSSRTDKNFYIAFGIGFAIDVVEPVSLRSELFLASGKVWFGGLMVGVQYSL